MRENSLKTARETDNTVRENFFQITCVKIEKATREKYA
jgi:hypothetical protein